MSAFFSRYSYKRVGTGFYFDSNLVSDSATGAYDLNTTDGNRPVRRPVAGLTTITPVYRSGERPQSRIGAANSRGRWFRIPCSLETSRIGFGSS